MSFHVRPVLLQHRDAEWIDLNLPATLHPGTLKTEIHPTDPCKERSEGEFLISDSSGIDHTTKITNRENPCYPYGSTMLAMKAIHPLDAGLLEIGIDPSGIPFPPDGWQILQEWGLGYALRHSNGLRVLIDCSLKEDNFWWVHVSFSRKSWDPTHVDACQVKQDFLGDRYAYTVHPPREKYVNIHTHCLHLWSRVDGNGGLVLPEFSEILEGIGRSV